MDALMINPNREYLPAEVGAYFPGPVDSIWLGEDEDASSAAGTTGFCALDVLAQRIVKFLQLRAVAGRMQALVLHPVFIQTFCKSIEIASFEGCGTGASDAGKLMHGIEGGAVGKRVVGFDVAVNVR